MFGVDCEVEDGSAKVSLSNLKKILATTDRNDRRREVQRLIRENGKIFVCFCNMETYLALGFGFRGGRLAGLGWGDDYECRMVFEDFPTDWEGELPTKNGPIPDLKIADETGRRFDPDRDHGAARG